MHDNRDLFNKIRLLIEYGNIPEALIQLRHALDEDSNNGELRYYLAACLAEIGEYKEACEHVQQALRIEPGNPDFQELLREIQDRDISSSPEYAFSRRYFNLPELTGLPLKECPNCHEPIDRTAWQCRHCGHLFIQRITITMLTLIIVTGILLGAAYSWYASFMGLKYHPATVINKAGEDGERIQVSEVQWYSTGLGLTQSQGTGFSGRVFGSIRNQGNQRIEKAVLTIFLNRGDGDGITFVWFDVDSWPPGAQYDFDFPGLSLPDRAGQCEIRIESVELAPVDSPGKEETSFYVPQSNHFPAYRFRSPEGKVLSEKLYAMYASSAGWSFKIFLRAFGEIIPAFILNYLFVMGAVLLVNICDKDRKWNEEWALDALGAAFVVTGFIVINILVALMSATLAFVPKFVMYIRFAGLIAKVGCFAFFFKRSLGWTLLMLVFYACLLMSAVGFWANITAPAEKTSELPPPYTQTVSPHQ